MRGVHEFRQRVGGTIAFARANLARCQCHGKKQGRAPVPNRHGAGVVRRFRRSGIAESRAIIVVFENRALAGAEKPCTGVATSAGSGHSSRAQGLAGLLMFLKPLPIFSHCPRPPLLLNLIPTGPPATHALILAGAGSANLRADHASLLAGCKPARRLSSGILAVTFYQQRGHRNAGTCPVCITLLINVRGINGTFTA
jgi:hypothetical protein